MVRRSIRVSGRDLTSVEVLSHRFEAIHAESGIPAAFPPEVLAADGVGLLRTLPGPDGALVERSRRQAAPGGRAAGGPVDQRRGR